MVKPIIPFLVKEGIKKAAKKYGEKNLLKISDTKKLLKEIKPVIDKKNKASRSIKTSESTKNLNKAQERVHVADEYKSYVTNVMKNKLPKKAQELLKKPFDKVLKARKTIRDAFAQKLIKKDN
jgi:hypothetical protein